jgi:gamma-glutamylcyclotransferase (GGCT)/AIG2-like uncharacterized protein YtfP
MVLAVYGTLMRAFDRREALGVAGALTYRSRCRFAGRLYDLGRFPGAVPGRDTVRGELFRIEDPDVLRCLDRYEGYDPDREGASLFVRRTVSLEAPEDTAWVYWYNGDVEDAPRVPAGDWAAYADPDRS